MFRIFFIQENISGTDQERGLIEWRAHIKKDPSSEKNPDHTYDLPFGMNLIRKLTWTRFIPCMPTYRDVSFKKLKKVHKKVIPKSCRTWMEEEGETSKQKE